MTAPPECAEAPKLCPLSSDGTHILDRSTERCVYCLSSVESVLEQERSRLTTTPGSGAWVNGLPTFECKICDKVTPRHLEHQVAYPNMVEGGFCPACFPIAERRARLDSLAPATATPSPPTCSECKAPAVRIGMCGYCCDRTQYPEASTRALTDARVTNAAARKRLAAIEQKRPRVNAAERAMLERGHPSFWPSNEGEE